MGIVVVVVSSVCIFVCLYAVCLKIIMAFSFGFDNISSLLFLPNTV